MLPVQLLFSPPQLELLDRFLPQSQNLCACDFGLTDAGHFNGQVEATTWGRDSCFAQLRFYVGPLGMDPYIQDTPFCQWFRVLTGFAARVHQQCYGQGKQVCAATISGAIIAIGQTSPWTLVLTP